VFLEKGTSGKKYPSSNQGGHRLEGEKTYVEKGHSCVELEGQGKQKVRQKRRE